MTVVVDANIVFSGILNSDGKIQRFVSNNYGLKDKDFALYRIAGYFS
ncbi:hypothetical protein [Candidatus Symbiothrix dinenymphae]|nr:hypothetical protein [Candidatus Symbiothrix dinenymphae]